MAIFQRFFLPFLAGMCTLMANAAPPYEPIAAFQLGPTGAGRAKLIRHTDGYFYGVSAEGGTNGAGTIFKLSPAGELSTWVNFDGLDGGTKSELVSDGQGAFWGTTFAGGSHRRGSIYKVDIATGKVTTVVDFPTDDDPIRGRYVRAGLVYDHAGFFWGTTQQGGAGNIGTLFKVEASTGLLTTVADFSYSSGLLRGAYPAATLVSDANGVLWGAAAQGGEEGRGTIFKVNPATGTVATVADFSGASDMPSYPEAELFHDGAGFLWGTSRFGGATGHGTVFKFNLATAEITRVVSFTGAGGAAPGGEPEAGLVKDAHGFLWGTTRNGGSGDFGTVFKVDAVSGSFECVVQFTDFVGNAPGRLPRGTLAADGAGRLWGLTRDGGPSYYGTVFRVNPSDDSIATILHLTGSHDARGPIGPTAGLAGDGTGFLWGITYGGGLAGRGTIYKVHPLTGTITTVVDFTGVSGPAPGAGPAGTLVSDGAGFFWGSTVAGGAAGTGSIFKVEIATGAVTSLAEFKAPDDPSGVVSGQYPNGHLVNDGAGFFWGTTSSGGTGSKGTVFKVHAATGELTTVVHFAGVGQPVDGAQPTAGLCADGAGFLWGTTLFGGMYGNGAPGAGTVFKVNVATGAIATVVYFTGPGGSLVGQAPEARLVPDGLGHLWGTTSGGGPNYEGTIFKVNISSGAATTVLSFTYPVGAAEGSEPYAGLASDGAGSFWGTTQNAGPNVVGSIFRIGLDGAFEHHSFFTGNRGPVPGAYPGSGTLYRHSDGNLYGVTGGGGINPDGSPAGGGQIFRIRLTGSAPPLEAWKLAHLGHPFAPDDGDHDGDGLKTLGEYGLQRLPLSPDAGDVTPVAVHDEGAGRRLRLLVPRDPARSDVRLAIQGATDLSGPWEEIAVSEFGAPFAGAAAIFGDSATLGPRIVEVRDVFDLADGPRRFLRMEISR